MTRGDEALWTDPAGRVHRVLVEELSLGKNSTATISYWDNQRRGLRSRAGRTFNHGTRARVVVWLRELKPSTTQESA